MSSSSKTYASLNDDILLDIVMKLDPSDVEDVIKANKQLNTIYNTHQVRIWKHYIQRDLGDYPGSSYEDYVDIVARLLTFDPKLSENLSKRLQSVMRLPLTLLSKLTRQEWTKIIRVILKEDPSLLARAVEAVPNQFYKRFDDLDTEFTYLCLSNLYNIKEFDEKKAKIAVPYVFALFVNPSKYNPTGLFNKDYSTPTKDFFKEKLRALQSLVPLTF